MATLKSVKYLLLKFLIGWGYIPTVAFGFYVLVSFITWDWNLMINFYDSVGFYSRGGVIIGLITVIRDIAKGEYPK